jgi:hypothetical protein
MYTLTFIAELVKSLAWPITVLIVIWIVIKNSDALRGLVQSIRVKDLEIVLRQDFEKARDAGEQVKAELIDGQQPIVEKGKESAVLRLAAIDTGVAILRSWQRLEGKVVQLIQHNGLMRFTVPDKFVQRLEKLGKLTETEASLYQRLRRIRNEVVHSGGRAPTVAEVVEYDELVDLLVSKLEVIRQQPDYIGPDK